MRALRRLVSCLLILVLVLVSGHAYALDTPNSQAIGPEGGWITALAASPAFDSDGMTWVATFGGHIFSRNGAGGSWNQSYGGETDPVIEAIAASPAFSRDRTVFAAADEGVFKSIDGGASWGLASAGLAHHFCRAIIVSPTYETDRTAYAATDAGVYRTTDGGASWNPPLDGARAVVSLAEVPAGVGDGTLLAGLDSGGMEQSTDGGVHWQSMSGFSITRRALAIVTLASGSTFTAIVATDGGIWRYAADGSKWSEVGAAGDRVDALAISPTNSQGISVYAGSAGGHGVYASYDTGATWTEVGAPGVPFVTTLASAGASTLLAGTTGGGIAASTDGGHTWRDASNGLLAFQVQALRSLAGGLFVAGNGGALERATPNSVWSRVPVGSTFVTSLDGAAKTVVAGTQDMGLLISRDGGRTWAHSALQTSTVGQVAVSSPDGANILAAGDYIYRSADAGASFSRSNLAGTDVRSFALSPAFRGDGIAFVGTLNHGVYRTADGGSTWQPAAAGLPSAPIMEVLLSPTFEQDGTLYVATAGNGIYVSTSEGAQWVPLLPAIAHSVVDALAWTQSGALVAGTDHGMFLLESAGWVPVADARDIYVSTLQDVDSAGTEYLYAGTTGQGVWETTLGTPLPATSGRASPLPTAAIIATPAASPDLLPTPTPRATTKPTSVPRAPAFRMRVDPVPVVAHRAALLTAVGPAGGRVQLRLQAGTWQRKFSGALGKDGTLAFGFVAPPLQISLTGLLTTRGRSVTSKVLIPVIDP